MADIFRLYGATYWQSHPVSPAQHKVIDALRACRTATLGGYTERCAQCGFERSAYRSCRNRHCPKCQSLPTAQWLEARTADLLPVPYFHTVFTLPHDLNPLVLRHKRVLLPLLFHAASETLLQFGQQNLGGQLGVTMVLHTWDQLLNAHFHVHCLVPAGALAEEGTRWVPSHPRFLFPVHAMSTVFRAKFLETLRHLSMTAALARSAPLPTLGTPRAFSQLLDHLYDKDWVVYTKPTCPGPGQVLDYLGRYTHRVAIANHRLVAVDNGQVSFTYRNRRRENQQQIMTLTAHEFIRRFLLHLVPHGFVRIRHYGFLANRCKAGALRHCRQLLGQPPAPPPRARKTVAQWMQRWTGRDITRCPQCGHHPLVRLPLPMTVPMTMTRAPPRTARAMLPSHGVALSPQAL